MAVKNRQLRICFFPNIVNCLTKRCRGCTDSNKIHFANLLLGCCQIPKQPRFEVIGGNFVGSIKRSKLTKTVAYLLSACRKQFIRNSCSNLKQVALASLIKRLGNINVFTCSPKCMRLNGHTRYVPSATHTSEEEP